MSVAFDWAMAVELVVLALAALAGFHPRGGPGGHDGLIGTWLYPAALLCAAFLSLALGEGLRQGRRWAWGLQLAAGGLLTAGGLAGVVATVRAVHAGGVWPAVPAAVLLLLSPVVVWRLSRPATRLWIYSADRGEARRRHGGLWLVRTAGGASVGGLLVALAILFG